MVLRVVCSLMLFRVFSFAFPKRVCGWRRRAWRWFVVAIFGVVRVACGGVAKWFWVWKMKCLQPFGGRPRCGGTPFYIKDKSVWHGRKRVPLYMEGCVVWESRGVRCAECAAVVCVEEGVVYKRCTIPVSLVCSACVWEGVLCGKAVMNGVQRGYE